MELIGYLALILLGVVLGTFGMGGSMLAIPIFVYVFSLNMVTASAYALFISGMTSLAGFALRRKDHLADLSAATVFGIPSIAMSFVTRKWILENIPAALSFGDVHARKEDLLSGLVCVLMAVSAVLMITRTTTPNNKGSGGAGLVILFPAGMVVGLIAGLAGAGGGFLILPSLMIFGRLAFSVAIGTTLIIISLNSLVGFCGDVLNQTIRWQFLLIVTTFCFAGLILGYSARNNISRYIHQRSFGWLLAMVAAGMVVLQIWC